MDRLQAITAHLTGMRLIAASVVPMATAAVSSISRPIRVCVTGAAGQIAYSLIPMIGSGAMFGSNQPVIIHLLDIPPMEAALAGVVMEIEDCAFPCVQGVLATSDPMVAFKDIDVAILVGAFPRKDGMQRKDLLEKNAAIFETQGKALDAVASRNVKVLVVGNPANTNALICQHNAPSIPAQNFTALTRLDLNRAKMQIALRAGVPVESVHNVIIWGNHSATQYPDVTHAVINDWKRSGISLPVSAVVNDTEWLQKTFIPLVQQRGAAVIKARKLSSAASAANAIVDHVRDWWLGSSEIVSMGVYSDGSYNVPKGLIFSFPVRVLGSGRYEIVQGLSIDSFSQQKLDETTKELAEERDTALAFLAAKPK